MDAHQARPVKPRLNLMTAASPRGKDHMLGRGAFPGPVRIILLKRAGREAFAGRAVKAFEPHRFVRAAEESAQVPGPALDIERVLIRARGQDDGRRFKAVE